MHNTSLFLPTNLLHFSFWLSSEICIWVLSTVYYLLGVFIFLSVLSLLFPKPIHSSPSSATWTNSSFFLFNHLNISSLLISLHSLAHCRHHLKLTSFALFSLTSTHLILASLLHLLLIFLARFIFLSISNTLWSINLYHYVVHFVLGMFW